MAVHILAPGLDDFLVVYEDDFKLVGKTENLQLARERIVEGINMDHHMEKIMEYFKLGLVC